MVSSGQTVCDAQPRGQWRARCHDIRGIDGNAGIVESVSYRIERVVSGPNPTLSGQTRSFVFLNLPRPGGFSGVIADNEALRPAEYAAEHIENRRV